jgi:hypothetical protein
MGDDDADDLDTWVIVVPLHVNTHRIGPQKRTAHPRTPAP